MAQPLPSTSQPKAPKSSSWTAPRSRRRRLPKPSWPSGGQAIAIAADVTKEDDTAAFIAKALEAYGQLNIVVTCAGIIRDGLTISPDKETKKVTRKLGLDKWQQVIDVNLTGTFLTMRDAAEAMANGGWPGLLVGISSVNKVGQVGQINYASTKAAVALMPKILVGESCSKAFAHSRSQYCPWLCRTSLLQG